MANARMNIDSGATSLVGQAVLFFEDGRVFSELRWAEFQSLVEGAATVEQFAGRILDAAYAEVGQGLTLRSLVFFRLAFDKKGAPSRNFALPVTDLAQRAALGPDLGQGRVRIASRSQCPIPWVAAQLWEPKALVGDSSEVAAAQRALWRNRLGFKGAAAIPPAPNDPRAQPRTVDALGQTGRYVVPQLIRQYKDRLDSLQSERDRITEQLRVARAEVASLTAELGQERTKVKRLEKLIRGNGLI